MCVNYKPLLKDDLFKLFNVHLAEDWPAESYQNYPAPIIRRKGPEGHEGIIANYGMIPKQHTPSGIKSFSTMNARSETVGQLRSYKSAWLRTQLCLIPLYVFYEPNWESGKPVRWAIGMADHSPFAVAGLWREWKETDGRLSYSFTQLTINADEHPLMQRFHKPENEKRSLVIIHKEDYEDWLHCTTPEEAHLFLRPYPAKLMAAWPEPKTKPSENKSSLDNIPTSRYSKTN